MVYFFASLASAQPKHAGTVLVLEVRDGPSWKDGVQALVAELLATGYELSVRAAQFRSLDQLEQELQRQVADSSVLAGVSITREGSSAMTLLCRRDAVSCERFEMDASEGELSRSRLALAVVERLRPLDLPVLPEPTPPSRTPRPSRVEPAPTGQPAPTHTRPLRVWLGGGAVLSSGASTPLSWLGASLEARILESWGIELGFGGSPLSGRAESQAGTLSLRYLQADAFATFEPLSNPNFGLSLGLGGGAVRLYETATPAPGFDAFSENASVGMISARARLWHRFGRFYWGLSIDPGMLVPAATVLAGTETILQLGQPWVSLRTSVGLSL